MKKREKVYCGQCIHYSARKRSEVCAKAVIQTIPNTATYLHPDMKKRQECWKKNKGNRCTDFEKKVE